MSAGSVDLIRDQQEIADLEERLKYANGRYELAQLCGKLREVMEWEAREKAIKEKLEKTKAYWQMVENQIDEKIREKHEGEETF